MVPEHQMTFKTYRQFIQPTLISLMKLSNYILETSNNLPGCDNSNESGYKRIIYSVDQILKIGEMHKEMLLEANFRVGTSNKQKEKADRQKRCQKAKKVSLRTVNSELRLFSIFLLF